MMKTTRVLLSCAIAAAAIGAAPAMAADGGDRDLFSAPQTVPDILSSKEKQL